MSTLKRIYIACDEDSEAVGLWHLLRDGGLIPYCPNINKVLGFRSEIDDLDDYNLTWIGTCDAVFRVHPFGGREAEYARERDIPVFTEIDELLSIGRLRLVTP